MIFLFRKKHKFLFDPKELKISENLKSLANYYSAYLKFFKLSILLDNCYTRQYNVDQIAEDDFEKFFGEFRQDCKTLEDFFDEIDRIEIKNYYKQISLQKIMQGDNFWLHTDDAVSR